MNEEEKAYPFLKWAGGKRQLLPQLDPLLPHDLRSKKIYIENFVGAGAMFFHLHGSGRLDQMELVILNDINTDLMLTYLVIKDAVDQLIAALKKLEKEYLESDSREGYYYQKRKEFNAQRKKYTDGRMNLLDEKLGDKLVPGSLGEAKPRVTKPLAFSVTSEEVWHAALMIFLNKAGFNGLYRLNRQGDYNVPHGKPKRFNLCQEERLRLASKALSGVLLLNGDYDNDVISSHLEKEVFMYVDPPYRPLKKPGNPAPIYTAGSFTDRSQEHLRDWLAALSPEKVAWMLSNSDPKNSDAEDAFFDNLYADYDICRVEARRSINSDGEKRGSITELVVRNY